MPAGSGTATTDGVFNKSQYDDFFRQLSQPGGVGKLQTLARGYLTPADMAGGYTASTPAAATQSTGLTPTPGLGSVADAYLRSFNRGGQLIDLPSFQELYGSYRDVASQQAARAGANINESFGSQGARYGSDLLRAQGGLQRDLATDLRSQSANFLTQLRGQQSSELLPIMQAQQQAGQFGAGLQESQYNRLAGLGGLQAGLNQQGLNLMFQDFLRRTSPPPLLGAASGFGGGFQGSTTVAF